MEVRFFAPGNLVSNLDFVESIFGNGGDPQLAENDAALDVEHWTGHTGCVILAPHLVGMTKQEVGLPHWGEATDAPARDGMCWKEADELLQRRPGLQADRARCIRRDRDPAGGQLFRLLQEGSQNADQLFRQPVRPCRRGARRRRAGVPAPQPRRGVRCRQPHLTKPGYSFDDMVERYGEIMDVQPEGYAIDNKYPDIIYVPQKRAHGPECADDQLGDGRRDADHPPAARQDLHAAERLQDRDGETSGRAVLAPGGYGARKEPSATSPARYPAAASPKSPSH